MGKIEKETRVQGLEPETELSSEHCPRLPLPGSLPWVAKSSQLWEVSPLPLLPEGCTIVLEATLLCLTSGSTSLWPPLSSGAGSEGC